MKQLDQEKLRAVMEPIKPNYLEIINTHFAWQIGMS